MKLRDLMNSNVLKKKPLVSIMNMRKEPSLKKDVGLDRQIKLLQGILNSKTSIFPPGQRKDFERELENILRIKKIQV